LTRIAKNIMNFTPIKLEVKFQKFKKKNYENIKYLLLNIVAKYGILRWFNFYFK